MVGKRDTQAPSGKTMMGKMERSSMMQKWLRDYVARKDQQHHKNNHRKMQHDEACRDMAKAQQVPILVRGATSQPRLETKQRMQTC